MNRLSACSKDWLLDSSVEKCSVLRLRRKIKLPYCINGRQLNETSEQNDLGVLVSDDLKLAKHITSIVKKASQWFGMSKKVFLQ